MHAAEEAEHCAADHYVMEVRDDEIGVVNVDIETEGG